MRAVYPSHSKCFGVARYIAPPLPTTLLEHTKQYPIDFMATKAAIALLKDLSPPLPP